jgi:hypothetical protein
MPSSNALLDITSKMIDKSTFRVDTMRLNRVFRKLHLGQFIQY